MTCRISLLHVYCTNNSYGRGDAHNGDGIWPASCDFMPSFCLMWSVVFTRAAVERWEQGKEYCTAVFKLSSFLLLLGMSHTTPGQTEERGLRAHNPPPPPPIVLGNMRGRVRQDYRHRIYYYVDGGCMSTCRWVGLLLWGGSTISICVVIPPAG